MALLFYFAFRYDAGLMHWCGIINKDMQEQNAKK